MYVTQYMERVLCQWTPWIIFMKPTLVSLLVGYLEDLTTVTHCTQVWAVIILIHAKRDRSNILLKVMRILSLQLPHALSLVTSPDYLANLAQLKCRDHSRWYVPFFAYARQILVRTPAMHSLLPCASGPMSMTSVKVNFLVRCKNTSDKYLILKIVRRQMGIGKPLSNTHLTSCSCQGFIVKVQYHIVLPLT